MQAKSLLIVGLGFIIIIAQSCTSLPLVLEKNNEKPLTLSITSPAHPPYIINNEGTDILIHYAWNGTKSKFEKSELADGKITYKFSVGKSLKSIDSFDWSVECPLKESEGVIGYVATSLTDDVGGYVTGDGSLIFRVSCSYKDKDGNNHVGYVSNYLEIPVKFTYFLIN